MIKIKAINKISETSNLVLIIDSKTFKKSVYLTKEQTDAVKNAIKLEKKQILFNNGESHIFIILQSGPINWEAVEKLRKMGAKICGVAIENKIDSGRYDISIVKKDDLNKFVDEAIKTISDKMIK